MGYFKRRIKDSWGMTKELLEQINWKNAVWVIPSMIFFIPLIWFLMLFEDYEEIDRAKEEVNQIFKSK